MKDRRNEWRKKINERTKELKQQRTKEETREGMNERRNERRKKRKEERTKEGDMTEQKSAATYENKNLKQVKCIPHGSLSSLSKGCTLLTA